MNKIKHLIFILVCFIVFRFNASALTCQYNNHGNSMASKGSVTITIDENNNNAGAVITQANGNSVNNRESVANWGDIKGQFKSSGKCPTYVNMTYGGLFGAKVWAYYDESSASNDASKNGATRLTSTSAANDSTSGSKSSASAKSDLVQKANQCSGFTNTYSSKKIADCKNDEKITTKFQSCKNTASANSSLIGGFISTANGYVSQGYLKTSDREYSDLINKCNEAKKKIDDFNKALAKISTEEYNEDMGTDIKSSVSDDDVKDNEYYNEYKGNNSNNQNKTLTSDFLGICDASKSPKTLGAFKLGGIFITIAKIIAPVILIVMGMIDVSKAVVSNKDGDVQKSLKDFLKRVVAAVLIFFTPAIVLALFTFVDGFDSVESAFKPCMDCLLKPSDCQGSIGGK